MAARLPAFSLRTTDAVARAPARLTPKRWALGMGGALAAAAVALVVGAAVGSVPLSLTSLIADEGFARTLLFDLRLPRVLLAAVVGGALAVSGSALQSTLRNPLASPEIIGVSGGAAFAAVAALAFLPAAWLVPGAVPLAAFVGATVSTVLVFRLAHVGGRLDPYSQVLIGVIFNTFAAALILLVHAVVDVGRSHSIIFWLMGGISIESYETVALAAAMVGIAATILVREAPSLNLLALGDESASYLGVDVDRVRRRVFGASALLVGAVVSLCGIITFAGLIVPHGLRRLVGSDNRLLVPASLPAGAAFLVACDALARWVVAPGEIPVGAVTALAGGPFFVYLLRRKPMRQEGL
ncbi:MAG: iron complex transport system permease protein [Hyphomicrobiaceae bacterium]|jgi:iron complex transport system permease protein